MELLEKYVKDNNIKGYLTEDDNKKLIKIVKKDKKEMEKYNEGKNYNEKIETLEDYIDCLISNYNYDYTIENQDIKEMLYYIYDCGFDIEINKNGTLNLIDNEGVYLGGHDSYENFDTIESALERLEGSYLYDYFGIDRF